MSIATKSVRYLAKQSKDIVKFGEKRIVRQGVTDQMLDTLSPFRRLSAKPTTLSDPKYFIQKFETETGEKFLPLNWANLSEVEKVDFIVKDRYSKLVSHKIMGNIKSEKAEHFYSLDSEGNIVFYKKGNKTHCSGEVPVDGSTIHNHPGFQREHMDLDAIESVQKHKPELLGSIAHGGEDIKSAFLSGERRSYVVDAMDNRFLLEVPIDIRTAKPLDKLSTSVEPMGYINKGDNVTLFAFNKIRPEKDSKVYEIFEKGKKYQQLKGTPEYSKEEMSKIILDFNCAKAEALPNFTWREEMLNALAEQIGFRFKKIKGLDVYNMLLNKMNRS